MYRVGILSAGSGSVETLRQSLRDLGYIEGRNVILEIRDTEGKPERANDLALQLTRLKVDVIVATHPAAVFSAKRATAIIPIVMMHTPDPVQLRLVRSLAHPGGNITGTTTLSVDLSIKPMEQPTKFDLVVNLKTAQVLGLTIPHSVLTQATEVIQQDIAVILTHERDAETYNGG